MKLRKLLALAAGSALAVAPPARAQDPALFDAVRAFEPAVDFAFDPASARVADFNGDGLQDVSAILVAPDRRALVVFNANRDGGYAPYPLYAVLPPGDVEVRLVPPGRRRVLGPQGVIDVQNPSIELVFPGRSSALYLWRDGRYQVFGTESH